MGNEFAGIFLVSDTLRTEESGHELVAVVGIDAAHDCGLHKLVMVLGEEGRDDSGQTMSRAWMI